jgi:hypothetical protein
LIGNKLSRSRREKIKERKSVPTKEPKTKRSRIEEEAKDGKADSNTVLDQGDQAVSDGRDNRV